MEAVDGLSVNKQLDTSSYALTLLSLDISFSDKTVCCFSMAVNIAL